MIKKIIISLTIVVVLTISIILVINKKEEPFYLENIYYGKKDITEIDKNKLNELTEKKESFAVFVYQPMCITSSDFESVLQNFLEENQISIYKIAFSNIKDTELGSKVQYYPSFIIYKKGKIVDFLEANKDEDVDCYTKEEGFKNWFTKYIKLRDKNDTLEEEKKPIEEEEKNSLEKVNLENVVKEENKVNIYFFWGDGCPHCEKEHAFFEEIKENYGHLYNLYSYETWHNEENAKIMQIFSKSIGEKVTGVPYTIIGEKTFNVFGEKSKDNFINAIKTQYKNSYDVYFDKIKKSE